MDSKKKKRLEEKGWRIGSTEDFLELSAEESAYIELKMALSENLKSIRKRKRMTQAQLAKVLNSSQSRIAKMESGDPSVSLDLLFRSLFTLGQSVSDLAKVFEHPKLKIHKS